jgi:hypothetical protein
MFIALYLAGLGASEMLKPQTATQTCAIVEAGYRTFMGKDRFLPPERVALARKPAQPMGDFVASYRQYLGLTPAEFADMEAKQHVTGKAEFLPRCDWLGIPAEHDGKTGGSAIAFNEPIVSTDGKLALVEVSSSEGISGWGELCVLRLTSESWTGRCVKLWSMR